MAAVPATVAPQQPSLLAKLAGRFNVEPGKMLATLKSTAFKGEVNNEQMMALLIVADQYGLNPWTKEIYAFPDKGGIVPVVGVDGWLRIINSHPMFDGMEYVDGPDANGMPAWIECVIYRKDRSHPIRVREYMIECKRGTQPWSSHPRRMLRHKATIQAGRTAFGFVGIYDQDEADRILAASEPRSAGGGEAVAALNRQIAHRAAPPATEPATDATTIDADGVVVDAPVESGGTGAQAAATDPSDEVSEQSVRDAIREAKTQDALEAAGQLIQFAPKASQMSLGDAYAVRLNELRS